MVLAAPSRTVRFALLAAVSLAGLALAGTVWDRTWDDSAITLGYSRTLAATGEIRFGRYGERVEGFSTLLWMLACAGLARFLPDPDALLNAARAACGALYLTNVALAYRLARGMLSSAGAALAVSAAFALTTVAVVSVPEAMENHLFLTLHLALALAYLGLREDAGPVSIVGMVLLPPLLFLCRPEGALTGVALVVALLADRHELAPAVRARVVAGLAMAGMLTAGVVFWRQAYFGTWAPNSVYAKTWPPYFQPLPGRLLSGLTANARFALAAFAWVLPAVVPRAGAAEARALLRRHLFFALSIALFALYHLGTGNPRGPANRVFLAVLPFAMILAVAGIPRPRPVRLLACALVFVFVQAYFYREYREAPITIARVKALLAPAVRLGAIGGARPLHLAAPDMGATLLYWGLDVHLIDTALLNNREAARSGWSRAGATIFAGGEPHIIETHSPWTELNGLADDPHVAKHYLRASVDGRFYLVERTFLDGILTAASRAGVRATPADEIPRAERDRIKETVFTDFPVGASGLPSSWRWAITLPR